MRRHKGADSPPDLYLRLFGGFALDRDGSAADGISYEKARALLAYVVADSAPSHSRKALAALFWPDLPLNSALANLRLILLNLRQVLEALDYPLLQIDRENVRAVSEQLAHTDFARFVRAVADDAARLCDDERSLAQLTEAAGLYRGELLAGFSLPECPAFEEWLQLLRETCQRGAITLLARLADAHERRGAITAALPFATRCLEIAPWDEDGHRRVMRLLALNGQPGAALSQFDQCRRLLLGELGVAPGEATRKLAEQISRGELAQARASEPVAKTRSVRSVSTNERRQVTVLYAERVDAIGDDDPEDLVERLNPVLARWRQIASTFGGHVVPTYAGGLLAYFGYPVANESAVRSSLLAALAIAADPDEGRPARIGVHTGMVVSGGNPAVPDVIGSTTASAIRLRLSVEPGGIAVSEDTCRLAAGYFDFVALGEQSFLGMHKPMATYRLIAGREGVGRLEAAERLTPLAGREMEISALMSVWQDVTQGHCHVIQLRGDAGIGKSRLLRVMKERLAGLCVVRELRCHAEFGQTPFYPIIALFEGLLNFGAGDDEAAKFEKLVAYVRRHHEGTENAVIPALAEFLALPILPPFVPVARTVTKQHEVVRDMLLQLLGNLAAHKPVLLLIEDVQWADPSTIDLISNMLAAARRPAMLVLITSRSGFAPPWAEDSVPTWLLAGLPGSEIGRIIANVAPDIDAATARLLVARADGIPLFAEELAKYAADAGSAAIPATLQDLLAARLDAAGDAKATAQLAATVGRAFSLDVLRLVSSQSPLSVLKSLRGLESAALIESRDGIVYQFRHALFRDAAYLSQSKAQRQETHLHIAEALRGAGTRFVTSHPELLARHSELGGDSRQAVAHWLTAGNRANQQAANAEAMLHFKAGLRLIETLPEGPERTHVEFELLNGLGLAASACEGYASREAAEAHSRAMSLCEQHAGSRDMFRAVWGLWAGASSRSGYEHAEDLANQLMHMARGSGDPVKIQQAHFALGNTCFWQGLFGESREHLERVITLHRPGHHARHIADFGEDVRITAGAYLAWALAMLGAETEASKASAETLALARRSRHPYSLAYALTFSALLQCRLRDPEQALLHAAETARLAERHGFDLWRIGAEVARGWASVQLGNTADVEAIGRCSAAIDSVMSGVALVVLGALADAQSKVGLSEAVLVTVDRAMHLGESIQDRHLYAELLCLKGEALLAISSENALQAADCFREALATGRLQQAVLIEQRAREGLLALVREGVISPLAQ